MSIGAGSRKSGHKVGSNKGILRARQERRREEAEERQRLAAARNPLDQLLLIETRPGESKKERERIGKLARTAMDEIV